MTTTEQIERINILNLHKRFCGINKGTLSIFDAGIHPEYWFASDIMPLYYSKNNIEYFVNEIVPSAIDKTTTGTHTIIMDKNAKLSRYAIYCIISRYARNNLCDLVYFMSPDNTPYKQIISDALKFKRIELRKRLKYCEQDLGHIIKQKQAGFAETQSILHQSLFGGEHIHETKQNNGISKNKPIADYIGAWTLYAKITAINETIKHINREPYTDLTWALQHYGTEQRNEMIQQTGHSPEYDIHKPIQKLILEFEQKKNQFISQYASEKIY